MSDKQIGSMVMEDIGTGEVVVMRMHKGNIIDELKGLIFNALLKAEDK